MNVTELSIPDVLLVQPRLFGDDRGFFFESFNLNSFRKETGLTDIEFVQDNHSRSSKNVLRGLHYQIPPHAQGKLVRVCAGEILDVAVDMRATSPTLGQWVSQRLDAESHEQLWVPAGFAHGFLTLSDSADVLYKTTDYYAADAERAVRWDDPDLAIDWNGVTSPLLSGKDAVATAFAEADRFAESALR